MFIKHKLSDQEKLSGLVLSTLQRLVIENRIMELAEEIANAPAFRADETYFDKLNLQKGQMMELKSMLEASSEAEQLLNTAKE